MRRRIRIGSCAAILYKLGQTLQQMKKPRYIIIWCSSKEYIPIPLSFWQRVEPKIVLHVLGSHTIFKVREQ